MAKFGKRNPANYDPVQLARGIKMEHEHSGIAEFVKRLYESESIFTILPDEIYEEIAMDHLDEDPNYYRALIAMEAALKRGGSHIPIVAGIDGRSTDCIVVYLQYGDRKPFAQHMNRREFELFELKMKLLESFVDPDLLDKFETKLRLLVTEEMEDMEDRDDDRPTFGRTT